jgi:hypothetical protein
VTPAPTGEGVPQPGDRSARDTHNYAHLHASDIEEGEQTVHNPWPMPEGYAAVSDGHQMQPTDIATQAELDAHTGDTNNPHAVSHDQLGGVTANQHHNRAHTLGSPADHSDVDISTPPEVGQTLVWTGTYWVPGDAGGGGGNAAGYAETIGDGAETSYDVVHELGNTDVLVQVWDLGVTPAQKVDPDIFVVDEDTVRVSFAAAPDALQYRVVVVGVGGSAPPGGGLFMIGWNPELMSPSPELSGFDAP